MDDGFIDITIHQIPYLHWTLVTVLLRLVTGQWPLRPAPCAEPDGHQSVMVHGPWTMVKDVVNGDGDYWCHCRLVNGDRAL